MEAANAERMWKHTAPALDSPYSCWHRRLAVWHIRYGRPQGSRLHRSSGNIFTVAMLTLASSALCLAIMKSQHGNIIGSIITFYMIERRGSPAAGGA
jgi:uncharacterized membrane protein